MLLYFVYDRWLWGEGPKPLTGESASEGALPLKQNLTQFVVEQGGPLSQSAERRFRRRLLLN
jgi:hypothetical protein